MILVETHGLGAYPWNVTKRISTPGVNVIEQTLAQATEAYVDKLAALDAKACQISTFDEQLYQQLLIATESVFEVCLALEKTASPEALAQARKMFRKQTEPWVSTSYFLNRTRTWPRGYQGDFETLEALYRGVPITTRGIGRYFDVYVLSRPLACAVRARRTKLRQLLTAQLQTRPPGARLLNIASGSARELFEMPEVLAATTPQISFVDLDVEALEYARQLLLANGIALSKFSFLKHDARKFADLANSRQQFGELDIIYSAGLFDYLPDDLIVQVINSLYNLLLPRGCLIAPFKDQLRYHTKDCHWLSKWTGFRQRTEQDVNALLVKAGVPEPEITMTRDETGIMLFFVVTKSGNGE